MDAVNRCPQRHAEYQFNATTKRRFIELLPMGSPSWGGEDTLVNLPAATLRPCRLALDDRCLLELGFPKYPDKSVAALISAKVLVGGTIDRRGRAAKIEVRAANAKNVRGKETSADALVEAAVENVRSWRLEESADETPFNVTFEFEPTDVSHLLLEFQLPGRIIIRGNPSLLKDKH
jgi:hypothetical protein